MSGSIFRMAARRAGRGGVLFAGAMAVAGCAVPVHQQLAPAEAALVVGPAVRDNRTPLDPTYLCYSKLLARELTAPLSIAVGSVQDYTGRVSDIEGAAVTQGASPMLFSALAKLSPSVILHDRFDTRVAELELAYMDRRQLGDGRPHQVNGSMVPWKPYFGGTIQQSDYYIVGGITELNYNIQSAGAEARISQTGPKARTYTMNVAADLRLVNSRSLVVVSAVSVQKQMTGYEVGFEVFRFGSLFGSGTQDLIDINIGAKSQEPLQLGVRAVLEAAALKLLGDLSGVSPATCMPEIWRFPDMQPAASDEDEVPSEEQTTPEPVAVAPGSEEEAEVAEAPAMEREAAEVAARESAPASEDEIAAFDAGIDGESEVDRETDAETAGPPQGAGAASDRSAVETSASAEETQMSEIDRLVVQALAPIDREEAAATGTE